MQTCWRGGEGRARWQGECKGRTQTEGNWKINPGLAGECRLENRTEELGGRNKRHCIRVIFAGEGANKFLVEMKLGRAHYGIRCWRLVFEKRRQKQGKLWQSKQGVWRHLFPSLRRKLGGLMLRTVVGLWPLAVAAGRDCIQLGWAAGGQQGLETLEFLTVGQERVREPPSLALQSSFDLNRCALPFCSNKQKTWEMFLGSWKINPIASFSNWLLVLLWDKYLIYIEQVLNSTAACVAGDVMVFEMWSFWCKEMQRFKSFLACHFPTDHWKVLLHL